MSETNNETSWAILELMGHVKTGALISKDTQFGTALLRAEVPQKDGSFVTQLINPSSLYRVTICSEELARACADSCTSKPMNSWELKHLMPTPPVLSEEPEEAMDSEPISASHHYDIF